jgi:uracil-DNA glycosylase
LKARNSLAQVRQRIVVCARCPELRAYCGKVATQRKREFSREHYWGKPVPSIGAASARVLIVGLAPAAHGGNRTGRMFTGDGSAQFLAPALHRAGFATQPTSTHRGDGFALVDAFMTAVLRCAPPANKPTLREKANCASHMRAELELLKSLRVVVALGKIGFDAIYARLHERGYSCAHRPVFGHGRSFRLTKANARSITLIASYHPSRQNTNTGKLTRPMLDQIFRRARKLVQTR